MKEKIKISYTLDELSDLFNLPKWDEVEEINLDYFAEFISYEYDEARKEELIDEEAERRAMEVESKTINELFKKHHSKGFTGTIEDAISKTINELFKRHCNAITGAIENTIFDQDLELKEIKECQLYEFKPQPGKTWKDVAGKIKDIINGEGTFYYSSVKEFRESIPTTSYRVAALMHLHWLKRYPEVYGTISVRERYEDYF